MTTEGDTHPSGSTVHPVGPMTIDRPACAGLAGLSSDERITLMGLLMEAHAHLTRTLGTELEQSCGLPLSWFDVLVHLAVAPDRRLTMSQLGSAVLLTSGGVTRLADRMEEAGLVQRQHCPNDRRAVHVHITAEGERRLEEATAEHLRALDRHLIEPLTVDERTTLAGALSKLRGLRPSATAAETPDP